MIHLYYIALFSLYEFYFKVFSYKVFNEAISALYICHIIQFFPLKVFFGDDILRHCYNDYHGVSPLFSHWVLRSFILIYQSIPKFFPTGFFEG
jgi:hypothetical protein